MAKRRFGKTILRNGRRIEDPDVEISVAADLLAVEGIPLREDEVSYYGREYPLENFAVEQSASAIWAEKERIEHTPKTDALYKEFQDKLAPMIEKLRNQSKVKPTGDKVCGDISTLIRDKARSLGYGEVGFTRFDKRYIYSSRRPEIRTDLPNAICLAYEQDYVKTQQIPGIEAEIAQGEAYQRQAELSLQLSNFINELGYGAQISGPTWYFGPVIPMFVQSGLGQLGVNGQLLSPHFGSRARLQIIITDAPLSFDSPVDYGIYKFCEICQICFMRCPGKAIQAQRVWFRGAEKNKLIHKRCRPVMARYSGCGICMKVCPIQKYGMEPVMEHYLETGEVLGKGSDDLEGFTLEGKGYFKAGRVPVFDKEFFDMPDGKAEDIAYRQLIENLRSGKDSSDKDLDEIWEGYRAKVSSIENQKGNIVDMGMDIDS